LVDRIPLTARISRSAMSLSSSRPRSEPRPRSSSESMLHHTCHKSPTSLSILFNNKKLWIEEPAHQRHHASKSCKSQSTLKTCTPALHKSNRMAMWSMVTWHRQSHPRESISWMETTSTSKLLDVQSHLRRQGIIHMFTSSRSTKHITTILACIDLHCWLLHINAETNASRITYLPQTSLMYHNCIDCDSDLSHFSEHGNQNRPQKKFICVASAFSLTSSALANWFFPHKNPVILLFVVCLLAIWFSFPFTSSIPKHVPIAMVEWITDQQYLWWANTIPAQHIWIWWLRFAICGKACMMGGNTKLEMECMQERNG